jgi:ubiquinone/menaquinone biosynthesis C-methylase UbiE
MIGVDSGPLHVAGATSTETIGVWTHHHPVHYFDLAGNVLHFVPGNHEKLVQGANALSYFQERYRHQTYRELRIELPALVESALTGEDFERIANRKFLGRLSARSFDELYYEEHRRAGLDYLGFGNWQRAYGRWFVESLNLKGKRVLDVGCACGSILRGLFEAGALVGGVDLNEYMIRLGREKWPEMASQLHICDGVNLHLFEDNTWDAIHTAQAAEHWRPELVPHILRELRRVATPGALLFCSLDTEELLARQNRQMEGEDPTHVCIRPMSWWMDELSKAGWEVCTEQVEPDLRTHRESFITKYDWDWFAAHSTKKPG